MKTLGNNTDLNTRQVAQILGISPQMVRIYLKQGRLRARQYDLRGQYRFGEKEVLTFKNGK